MKKIWGIGSFLALVLLAAMAMMIYPRDRHAAVGAADPARSAATPRYSVIETQGFNLLVADNDSNKLYYYANDKDAPVGAPLKLRASLDLTQVGKAEIKITAHNLENIHKKEK